MLTTEIRLDTDSGPVTLNPRWLRIPAAVKYSGLSRSKLYELLSEGRIRSICVRSQKGAQRGIRLIDRESIDLFMESQESA
jgi:Helix-turn-helix domain